VRGRVQAKERPVQAHARERKGQNDKELMDNAMRPRDEEGVFYFVFYISNNELFLVHG
jgi:hypothetical protein